MSNTSTMTKQEEERDPTSNNTRPQSKGFIRSVLSTLLSNTSTWATRLRVLRQAEEQRLKLILERKKKEGGFAVSSSEAHTDDEVGKLSVGLVKESISGAGASVDFSLLEDIMFQMVYEDEDDEALQQLIEIKFEDEEIPVWRSDADTHVLKLDSSVTRERPLSSGENGVNKELVPYILTNPQMKNIAMMALPPALLYFSKWKRLYSLERDGDSFTGSFLRKVEGQAKTLLIIETTKGNKFGGYAECAWESQGGGIGGVFYGTSQSCLFSFRKKKPTIQDGSDEELLVYKWTGVNRYIQLIDVHERMIAFGGGGKEAEFGLCIQDDFRKGSTGRCATFGNDPLCEDNQFEIMNMEIWGFSGACLS